MSTNFTRLALISMCYKEVEPGRWLKPVGLVLFAFEEDKKLWSNFFKGADNESMHIWTSKTIENDEHFLSNLKQQEAYGRIEIGYEDSQFQLFAVDL